MENNQEIQREKNNTKFFEIEKEKFEIRKKRNERIKTFLGIYKYRVISILLGILTSIGLLTFGFFKTLLVWIVLTIAYLIGSFKDGDMRIILIFRRFFNM